MCGLVGLQLTRHFTGTHLTFYKFPIAVNFIPADSRSNCCVQNKIDWFKSLTLLFCFMFYALKVHLNLFQIIISQKKLYVTGVKIRVSEHQIIAR